MRWIVFAIAAYGLLVLDQGLATLWQLDILVRGGIRPTLLLILLVYVGLWAPAFKAVWAALILGLLMDLTPWSVEGSLRDVAILGPSALGCLVGMYVVLQLRTMVFRDSLITVSILTFLAGLFVHLVTVTILSFRGLTIPLVSAYLGASPLPGFNPWEQLLARFLSALVTALIALPVGWLLLRWQRWWAFDPLRGMGPLH